MYNKNYRFIKTFCFRYRKQTLPSLNITYPITSSLFCTLFFFAMLQHFFFFLLQKNVCTIAQDFYMIAFGVDRSHYIAYFSFFSIQFKILLLQKSRTKWQYERSNLSSPFSFNFIYLPCKFTSRGFMES